MKQFRCGDVVPGCEWVTRSEDEEALFEEIHVARARGPRDGRGSARRSWTQIHERDHRGLGADSGRGERADARGTSRAPPCRARASRP